MTMFFLVGGAISAVEIVAVGALMKFGHYMGTQLLKKCGEEPVKKHKSKVKCGKKRVVEDATDNELSLLPI
jgi:hypothetical protein